MARWRKQPNEKGLAGVCQTERGLELREKGKILIHVALATKGFSRHALGWYWYGLGQNTYAKGITFPTKEEAAANASTFYKKYKEEKIE